MIQEITRNLSAALRPRRFSEVVGYENVIHQLRNQFSSGRVPTAMLFEGMSRGGKTTLAKIIAVSVNCQHAPFGEPCDDCLAHEADMEILDRNCAAEGSADEIRDMLAILPYAPAYGSFRSLIFDECQAMHTAAQSVLLKPVESPDGNNLFMFCTSDPTKLRAELMKRCMSARYVLGGLMPWEVKDLIAKVVPHAEPQGGWKDTDLAQLEALLIDRGINAPGDIVTAVENLAKGMTPEESAVIPTISGKINVGKLCGAVIQGNWFEARELLEAAEPRDGADIRIILSGFFRKKLLEANCPPSRADLLTEFIHELTDHNTPETGLQLSAAVASVHKICNRVQGIRSQRSAA